MSDTTVTIFMCGDVMLGRGIDRILPHPSNPLLHERYVRNTIEYVKLAEARSGAIPKPVSFSYVWGEALREFERFNPDVKLINLETSITTSEDYEGGKGIHYRMHSDNVACLTAAKIDCCVLANNHVLDWGTSGLIETLDTLKNSSVKFAGAGRNIREARAPAVFPIGDRHRLLVFSYGSETSGIPPNWGAKPHKPGVNLLPDLSKGTVGTIRRTIQQYRQSGDLVVVSIHWGGNWGFSVPGEYTQFAHQLIEDAGIDLIHGHSRHHVQGIEVYRNKLILYGCGDFLDDYEGIEGYEFYRDDLGLMYFASLNNETGDLISLQMVPTKIHTFKVNRASDMDVAWLQNTLNREGKVFGTGVELTPDKILELKWK